MLMRSLSLIIVLSLITSSTLAQSCDVEMKEQLNACEGAYQAQKKLITDQKEQIDNYFKKDVLQHQIIDDQQKKLDSNFRNPVTVGLGAALLTVVVIGLMGHLK